MTSDRRPEPGSPWANHCPDAFPREWLTSGTLPAEFTRPATGDEADLITGRMTVDEYLRRTGKTASPSPRVPTTGKPRGKGKPSPVVKKLFGLNKFLDGLRDREPKLYPLAVVVWCWLWRCERDGRASTSERKLAERFGVTRKTVRLQLRALTDAGFLTLVKLGMRDHSPSIYAVRPVPKKPTSTDVPPDVNLESHEGSL